MKNVVKRDGRLVSFDSSKIANAILKAMEDVDRTNEQLAWSIANEISYIGDNLSVEAIQDLVESKLMRSGESQVAKTYIIYRNERSKIREKNSDIVKDVWSRLNAKAIQNANANVDEKSFSGREKEASSDIQKKIVLDYIMSPEAAEAHKTGLVYQHDLEKWGIGQHNCLQIDFGHIFKNGFKTRNGDVRPPNSFSTACQLVAVAIQCQSQVQYGGVGSVHIDTDLAPFVKMSFRKHYKDGLKYVESNCSINHDDEIDWKIDKLEWFYDELDWHIDDARLNEVAPKAYRYAVDMIEREGKQAAEGLFHNLNTLNIRGHR